MSANNIRVVCRFRPQNEREINSGGKSIINISEDRSACSIKGEASDHSFTFDRVFPPTITQKELFDECARPTLEDIFKGYNGTIFVYGQTSSGKTHTMMGPEGGKGMEDPTQKGLIPRLVVALFETIFKCSEDIEFLVKVSYVEIYMERIRDLLDISKDNLAIREDKARNIYIEGVTEVYAGAAGEVIDLMKQGTSNRSIAATKMNAESSRSHSLFIITINQKNLKSGGSKAGKLFLVDLAGSEKIAKTGAEGQTLEEAKMINKSLSTLGNVINALTDGKSTHVPYRDSKLTRILQESLGGNARTTLIINCSPSSYNEAETLSTLRFGSRAKNIKNKAKINQELSAAELKQRLAAAELEIERLKAHIAAGGGPLPTDASGASATDLRAQVADLESKLHDIEEQNSLMETNIENLTAKLAEKETEMDQLREELRAAKALEDQLRKTDAENGKALAELNSALGSLKFELKEKLLSLESAAALQASSVKDAAAAQEAMNALREELQHAQQEAEEATEMLKMKEIAWEEEKQRLLAEKSTGANEPAATGTASANALNAARGAMTSLSVAQEAAVKAQADAGSLAAIVNASGAAPETEEARLKAEVARLTALLNASGDERVIRLEADLHAAREASAAKLQEFENLKAALVLDLKSRCDKIIDLELLLDEAREQYEELVKNASWKAAQHRNHALQQALDASQAHNQKLASELHAIRLEREVDEKKLAARTERIQSLEAVVQTAQEKLLAQQTMHQAELTKYRSLLDSMKGKMNPATAPHARIAKPIKGGAKATADGSAAEEESQEESGGFFRSFFRSPSKKNINVATSPPNKATSALSPRKPEEPAAAPKPAP